MKKLYSYFRLFVFRTSVLIIPLLFSLKILAQAFSSVVPLNPVTISGTAVTGEKPQSKVWTYDGKWWAVFPSSNSTHLWRLDAGTWTNVLTLTTGNAYADIKVVDNVTHILLYKGTNSELVSVQYVPATSTYTLWSDRTTTAPISLDAGVETATIDIDANGRMWLASDGNSTINVRWSDAPYSTWNAPVTVATGINTDDISGIIAMPGKTGVFWSNQNTERFGFKTINSGTDPSVAGNWSVDEVPASQSALDQGNGMADDHLNMKISADGTLYCVVKTSYDDNSYPRIVLLVRRPSGIWDNLYEVPTTTGTRPIIILNEEKEKIKVFYTSEGGGTVRYRESSTETILFGAENTLISGTYNNVTSAKANYSADIVILASSGSQVVGVLATDEEPAVPVGSLVAHWKMEEASGTTLLDASTYGNNGTTVNDPSRVPGQRGQALLLNGSTQYVTVPDHSSLDISSQITLAAWIRPGKQGTQYIIKKAQQSTANMNGYELSLANSGKVFFRFNQPTSGDAYRVNSVVDYPTNGAEWMHVAATYNGTQLKIYINGVLDNTVTPSSPIDIPTNNIDLVIGADGIDFTDKFMGALDDVRIYNIALTEEQISALAAAEIPVAPVLTTPADDATNVSPSPVLNWNAVSSATSYTVQVSTVADFNSTVYNQSNIAATSIAVPDLLPNTNYYWRVNAANSSGTGEWSETRSFTTASLPDPLVGYWKVDEATGNTLIDASTYGNNATVNGTAVRTTGIDGNALVVNATSQYATVPDNASLDITGQITLAAWIKPNARATQYIIKKAVNGETDGYELSLSSSTAGTVVFFRINQDTYANEYRVNSNTTYPFDGNTWMHIAGTYDGTTLRIYINGVLENSVTPAVARPIATNTLPLVIGAESNGDSRFSGVIDEARVYNIALNQSQITALFDLSVLPVSLSSFTGKAFENSITLNWETEMESNNEGFYIQRSNDGINFTDLGFVSSNFTDGNSSLKSNYSFTDNAPLNGNNYYRLRQVDKDGAYYYSKIITVKLSGESLQIQKSYPNPVLNILNLSLSSAVNSTVMLTVHDIAGRVIKEELKPIVNGDNLLTLDLSTLQSGIYVLKAKTTITGEMVVQTFIKQ